MSYLTDEAVSNNTISTQNENTINIIVYHALNLKLFHKKNCGENLVLLRLSRPQNYISFAFN